MTLQKNKYEVRWQVVISRDRKPCARGCFITAFPPKSREGNVFAGVCLSVRKAGPSCDHYPWFIGPHCTGTPSQRHGTSWEPLLVTSGDHLFRPFKLVNLGSPLELTSDGETCTISTSRCHSSYCKAFFILTCCCHPGLPTGNNHIYVRVYLLGYRF